MTTHKAGGDDKRMRILNSAQNLFLRYGVKRTSMDDVAREAGIAKGTLYLYFTSKNALFAALAERICATTLAEAGKAIHEEKPLTQRLVNFLDAYIGEMQRLIAHSPHVAELSESKKVFAAATYADFDRQIKLLLQTSLSEVGISKEEACDMFLAAAIGAIKTGDPARDPYRKRLTAIVEVLIAGLTPAERI